MANKVGSITVEVKPTVTLESACACVMMLNLFLADNEEYRLEISKDDGKWHRTDEPFAPAMGGVVVRPLTNMTFSDEEKKILADMPALRNLARMAGMETE